jgi:hypothetical protein
MSRMSGLKAPINTCCRITTCVTLPNLNQTPTQNSDPKLQPKTPNSESDCNSDRTSDGPDRTVRIAPANRNATRQPDRDNNRSSE